MALPENPITRKETYLAKIAGQEVQIPDAPITREEAYLDEIAKNGGGGGGYVLPTATESRLGGVKIGSGISVEEDGTISARGGGGTYADLPDKPSINDVELSGNMTASDLGLQDELTFDDVPTENSNNPVKSGGVYASDEAIRQWTTAEAKSVSGNPITLTDGSARNAEGLSVTCNPKQNLHGYDHPWAGGAGKNKLPMTVDGIKSANTSGTWSGNVYTHNGVTFALNTDDGGNIIGVNVSGTASANAYLEIPVTTPNEGQIISGCPSGGSQSTYNLGFTTVGYPTYVDTGSGYTLNSPIRGVSTKASIYVYSGYNASNLLFYPMLELGSTVTTFAPYTNECPITGYTECVVDRYGENKIPMTFDSIKALNTTGVWTGDVYSINGVDVTVVMDSLDNVIGFKLYGTATASYDFGVARDYSLPSGNYKLSMKSDVNNIYFGFYKSGWTNISGNSSTDFSVGDGDTIGLTRVSIVNGQTYNGKIMFPSIHLATDTPTSATISFGQTVYGGSVDFKTGKTLVDKKYLYVDGSDTSILSTATGQLQIAIDENSFTTTDGTHATGTLSCNILKEIYNTSPSQVGIYYRANGSHNLLVRANDYTVETTLSDWITWLGNNPLQIAYELATPIELTLTPAELELLKGYNYITTNGTTISLDYLPDSLLAEAENYVDAKIPPAPSSDGTYVLTCTVTSGIPAYSWESAT